MRAVGLDLGERRIGVSLSDSAGTLATPYEVVVRSGDRARDHRRLRELVEEAEAEIVVVGMPYSLDGTVGPTGARTLEEIDQLGAVLGVPITTYDERFTTVTADRSLRELHLDGRARRRVVDQVAAAVMLQGWLDRRRSSPPPKDEPNS